MTTTTITLRMLNLIYEQRDIDHEPHGDREGDKFKRHLVLNSTSLNHLNVELTTAHYKQMNQKIMINYNCHHKQA